MSKRCYLNKQAREIIYNVNCFMKNEAENGVGNLKQVQKRTAEAANVSISTVRRIMNEHRDLLTVFKTPGRNRPRDKPITGVNNFDQGVIRRRIHNFHVKEKRLPTVEYLRKKLQKEIKYHGSASSLSRIIKFLGFKRTLTRNSGRILIESSNIRFKRIEYLQRLHKYREEGRPIVYTDETYVDSTHLVAETHLNDASNESKKNIAKQRLIVVHAACETGFLSKALLTFKGETKSVDYHDNVKSDDYEKWLCNQLLPNLPQNSVVVINNASYHNKQCDPAPSSYAKKFAMKAWLTKKRIEFTEDMLKPQLYNLIKIHRGEHKKIKVDKILEENNHAVLRLPPYHRDLNPIDMAWTVIKEYIREKKIAFSVFGVTDVIKEKIELLGPSEWNKFCQNVRDIEEEYITSDQVVDKMTEEVIICGNDDGDDSNSSEDEMSNDEDYEDEEDEEENSSIKVEKDWIKEEEEESNDQEMECSSIKVENDWMEEHAIY